MATPRPGANDYYHNAFPLPHTASAASIAAAHPVSVQEIHLDFFRVNYYCYLGSYK